MAKGRRKKSSLVKKYVINKDNYLYYIFFILLLIVVVLGIDVYITSKKVDKNKGNIIVPVLKKGSSNVMTINLYNLASEGDYAIKIANYRGDTINKESIGYNIVVDNDSSAKIKITKDSSGDNLMIDQLSTKIEGDLLKKNKKDYDIYHFSVIDDEGIKKDDQIVVKISS